MGAAFHVCYAVEARFLGLECNSLTPPETEPGKPCKSRLFGALLRNIGASFPHALGGLLPGNALPAIGAVFDAVRAGSKGRAADGTAAQVLSLVKLGA